MMSYVNLTHFYKILAIFLCVQEKTHSTNLLWSRSYFYEAVKIRVDKKISLYQWPIKMRRNKMVL